MSRFKRLFDWVRRHPVALCLPIQAALLFYHLDLLPIWCDEGFTVHVAPRSLGEIGQLVRGDIHPPLYYFLLHFWIQLPLPGSLIVRMRALSALWVLLGTVLLDRLWLRRLPPRTRLWFLALWTLSPCLVLYGRMARSYSMQLAFACLALAAARRFLRAPGEKLGMLWYATCAALLLYVHYVPGLAVLAAASLVLLWRVIRQRSAALALPLAVSNLLVGAAYLPWVLTLWSALSKWAAQSETYQLVPNPILDSGVKLAYWYVSFTFGESLPVWGVLLGAALSPLILWLLWRALRPSPEWWPLVLPTALLGYVGVSRWVPFSFIPARLLFVLPLYWLLVLRGRERSPRLGLAVCGALLLLEIGALHSYFGKEDFLNKGYAAPFDQMAELVERDSPGNTLVVVDRYNTDAFPLLDRLQRPAVLLKDGATLRVLAEQAKQGAFDTVWHLRNTHDLSPGGLSRRLDRQLAPCYELHRHLFQPYSVIERWIIRQLGWPEQPTHFYEALQARRKAKCAERKRVTGYPGP
jgi:hypothetical protein